jgi:putative addiction module component (TIGR02574 family)
MSTMKRSESRILEDALKLPPEARAAIAGSLLDSLDQSPDPDAEAAWEAEVAKRIRDLDGQAVTPIPWSEARRTIVGGE